MQLKMLFRMVFKRHLNNNKQYKIGILLTTECIKELYYSISSIYQDVRN